MRSKDALAGLVAGALAMGTYAVGGCSSEPETNTIIKTVYADAGVGGNGGQQGAGGTAAAGGADGGVVEGDYPEYFFTEDLPDTTEENMNIVKCLAEKNDELKALNVDEPRLGLYIMSTEWCSFCGVQRAEWGLQAMKFAWDKKIYTDCEHDKESELACYTKGAFYIPSNDSFVEMVSEHIDEPLFKHLKREGVTTPLEFAQLFAEDCVPENAGDAEPSKFKGYVEALDGKNVFGYERVSAEERTGLEAELGRGFKGNVYKK